MEKSLQIRNSTAEFLTFVLDGKEDGVQVLYKDETIWATQKAMSILFDCSTDNIGLHLKNIFNSNELDVNSTTEKISVVQTEGDRDVNRTMTFYNLDAVISVGYRGDPLPPKGRILCMIPEYFLYLQHNNRKPKGCYEKS